MDDGNKKDDEESVSFVELNDIPAAVSQNDKQQQQSQPIRKEPSKPIFKGPILSCLTSQDSYLRNSADILCKTILEKGLKPEVILAGCVLDVREINNAKTGKAKKKTFITPDSRTHRTMNSFLDKILEGTAPSSSIVANGNEKEEQQTNEINNKRLKVEETPFVVVQVKIPNQTLFDEEMALCKSYPSLLENFKTS